MGRSMSHLIETVRHLEDHGVGFRSLTEHVDTTTPGGRLIFHVFGALAEFERKLIQERVKAGLAAARKRGRVGGRPTKLNADQLRQAKLLIEGGESRLAVAKHFGVDRSTLYRALRQ